MNKHLILSGYIFSDIKTQLLSGFSICYFRFSQYITSDFFKYTQLNYKEIF